MANSPQTKKVTACETCWKAKTKCCRTTEPQPKCDRCLRLNKPCFPHLSMQGRRPPRWQPGQMKNRNENKPSKAAAADVRPRARDAAASTVYEHINTARSNALQGSYDINDPDVGVGLNKKSSSRNELMRQPLPVSTGLNPIYAQLWNQGKLCLEDSCHNSNCVDVPSQDMNAEAFLKFFENNTQIQPSSAAASASIEGKNAQDMNDQAEAFLKSFGSNAQIQPSPAAASAAAPGIIYQDMNDQVQAFLKSSENNAHSRHSPAVASVSISGNNAQDMNDQAEAFLKSFENNTRIQPSSTAASASISGIINHDMNDQVQAFRKTFENNARIQHSPAASTLIPGNNARDINDQVEAFLNSFENNTRIQPSSTAASASISGIKIKDKYGKAGVFLKSNKNNAQTFLKSFGNNTQIKSPFYIPVNELDQESNISSPDVFPMLSSLGSEMRQPILLSGQSHCISSLKEWTKKALAYTTNDNVATSHAFENISSPRYLTAALKVAIFLSQYVQSLEVEEKLELLGTCNEWANQVVIWLKMTENYASLPIDTSAQNVLDVDSAAIQCLGSKPSASNDSTARIERRTMYFLALVFYELFHGGKETPSDLFTLASLDGAFISLSISTLVKTSKEDSGPKRRQGLPGYTRSIGLCHLHCDYLKYVGVPGPLSDLIFNMLDCVYGAFSSEDTYTNMVDVIADLQLMLDKPVLLRGLNMDKQSTSDLLDLANFVIPRKVEIQSILTCHQRCFSGSSEVVIITGESGVGKSVLAQCVAGAIISEGGLFLTGKFDAMQQSRPFSALTAALDQYLDLLFSQIQEGSDWAKMVTDKLISTFGQESSTYLINLLPRLGFIINASAAVLDKNVDSRYAIEMLHYLVCQFVDVISSTAPVSVTLCLDDVQWADEASISVLKRLLTCAPKSLFFLACCRNDEMTAEHPFWNVIETAQDSGGVATTFELNTVGVDALSSALSDLLFLPPRLVKPLSRIVHNKTKGNLLFIAQLLRSLNQEGLIRIDLNRQRWIWDEDEIHSSMLPDNVALCFANGINNLPMGVQLALQMLSMFGASAKHDCIRALERQMNVNVSDHLKAAVREGLISDIKDSYQFNHDRIQETCYKMIREHDRLDNHLTYGRCLVQTAMQTNDNDMLFTAINQINLAGPETITDTQEYTVMADYNMAAGKRAMIMSDYNLAYSLFDTGIAFLCRQEEFWTKNYNLSLELYELAAKTSLATGNVNSVQSYTDSILRHATSFDDTLDAQFTVISSLVTAFKMNDAFDMAVTVLARLGEGITSNLNEDECDRQIEQILSQVSGASFDKLLSSSLITNPSKATAMRILSRLQSPAFFSKSSSHPFLIMKMVNITISYGLASSSPMAFACFGSLLGRRDRIDLGRKFVHLAQSLLKRPDLNAKDSTGEVLSIVAEFLAYIQPLQSVNEILVEGEIASKASGDIVYQCLNRMQCVVTMFHAGKGLDLLKRDIVNAISLFKQHGQKQLIGPVLLLLERTTCILSVCDDSEAERANQVLVRIIREKMVPRQLTALHFHYMYLALIMNQADLKEQAEKFFDSFEFSSLLIHSDAVTIYHAGLASYRIYRETGDETWISRARKCRDQVKVWADQGCFQNFMHKYHLLEAEEHYCHGSFDAAKEAYKNATDAAHTHKFQNDEALAFELAARFYMETRDLHTSLEHFRLAHEKYHKWGAVSKADKLFLSIKDMFTGSATQLGI